MEKGIVFAGGGKWAVLALRKLVFEKANIVKVLCSEKDLEEEAKKLGLDVFKGGSVNSEKFVELVKENIDLIVNVSFPEIYGKEILNAPKFGIINAHGGKLPRYKGRSPINWAIINGETEAGVTVHFMSEKIDSGDILEQETVAIKENENFAQVKEKTLPLYPKLVSSAIKKALLGEKGKKQEGKPLYFPKRKPADSEIRWDRRSIEIHNLVRASFNQEYYAFTKHKNQVVYITETELIETEYRKLKTGALQRAGLVLDKNENEMLVGTIDGAILVKKAGFDKKNIENACRILKKGTRLGKAM